MKDTNDFMSQYNISGDFDIKTDIDFTSDDFGIGTTELNVTSDFGEGSQLNFDYGLDYIEYNPEMPDMMKALDDIKIPEMPDVENVQPQMTDYDNVEPAMPNMNDTWQQTQQQTQQQTAQRQQAQQQAAQRQQAQQQAAQRQQANRNAAQQQKTAAQQQAQQARNRYNANIVLTQEQQYRLKELTTQFHIVAGNPKLAHDVSSWQLLFNEYEDKADFANIKFVEAVVGVIENIPGIDLHVWRFFEIELLRYSDRSAPWDSIRNRILMARSRTAKQPYNNMQQNRQQATQQYGQPNAYQQARQSYAQTKQNWQNVQQNSNNPQNYNATSAAYARQQMHMAAKRAKEEKETTKLKWSVIIWVIIIIIAAIVIMDNALAGEEDTTQNYQQQYYFDSDGEIHFYEIEVD